MATYNTGLRLEDNTGRFLLETGDAFLLEGNYEIEDFESGTNGASVTTSSGIIDGGSGVGTVTYSTAAAMQGTLGARFASVSNIIARFITFNGAIAGSTLGFMAIKVSALPTATQSLALIRDSTNATLVGLRLNTDGTLTLRDNVTSRATSTTALTAGGVALQIMFGVMNGQVVMRIFDIDGNLLENESTLKGTYSGGATAIDNMLFGAVTSGSATMNIDMDMVGYTNTGNWPGPPIEVFPSSGPFRFFYDFEAGITGWAAGGSVPPAIASEAVEFNTVNAGSKSMKVTWGTGGTFPQVAYDITGLTIGGKYRAQIWVKVPAGTSPFVAAVISGLVGPGASNTTRGIWQQIWIDFTATGDTHQFQIWPSTGATSGDIVYVDDFLVSERYPGNAVWTFESDINEWYNVAPLGGWDVTTLSQSAAQAHGGTKSLKIVFPTNSGNNAAGAFAQVSGLIIGKRYRIRASVYSATSQPDWNIQAYFIRNGEVVTLKNAFGDKGCTFVATVVEQWLAILCTSYSSGNEIYVDDVSVEEVPYRRGWGLYTKAV